MRLFAILAIAVLTPAMSGVRAQTPSGADVRLRVDLRSQKPRHSLAVVAWLLPDEGTPSTPFLPHGTYTLVQKNREFHPHVQVVPVGARVRFPNDDPFFHNVFSLFDGKRFDLGLYEAGSSKTVTFQREGVSYIFCNIHPEMSAVILTLTTPLYAIAETGQPLTIHNVGPGNYEMRVWVEGMTPGALESLQRHVHVAGNDITLGDLTLNAAPVRQQHRDKFGNAYAPETERPY